MEFVPDVSKDFIGMALIVSTLVELTKYIITMIKNVSVKMGMENLLITFVKSVKHLTFG